MKKIPIEHLKKNGGAAMLISVVFFLFISLAIISGLVVPTVRDYKSANDALRSRQSFYLAESGAEDAYYRLKTAKPISNSTTLTAGENTAVTTIVDSGFNEKTISSLGDVSNLERKSELMLSTGTGVSFSYGVQSGTGGFSMANGSVVNGSVYSNGTITGSGSITGTALSANSSQVSADQANGEGVPVHEVNFGNDNSIQDFAQSFEVGTTGPVNKIDLYLKKISTPGNLTIKITSDSGGSPGATIASGVLSASLVSVNFGWVTATFSSNPELVPGITYWIVLDGGTNPSRYYVLGTNAGGYADGSGKIGQYTGGWNNTSPAGLDAFFKLYLGGVTGLIEGITVGSGGTGNAYAHTVNNSTIAGVNYCQTGSGNNKPCNTSLPDPTQIAMPISEQNILDWKAEALEGGVHSGDYIANGTSLSIGPKKITGNLTVTNSASLTVTGTLWVEGNVIVSNNATVRLSPSYGTSEGLIVTDGSVDIENNATFAGSGMSGSYLMVLSTSSSMSAITLSNNGGAVILYAANGGVDLANNAGAKALNGKYINLNNNAVITYDSGLVNSNFVNGPSGGWSITSWRESE